LEIILQNGHEEYNKTNTIFNSLGYDESYVTCDLPIKKFGHMLPHVCELTLGDCAGTEFIARACVCECVFMCVCVCVCVCVGGCGCALT